MTKKSESPNIRVGPAGWSYKDWSGIGYPKRRPPGFHEATCLAQYLDTIELNVTFYRPVAAQTAKDWVQRVAENRNFLFTAKLWQEFTHRQDLSRENEAAFRPGVEVLRDAGKLGALLVQFPWSFKNTKESIAYLDKLVHRFRDFSLVVEVRHSSWDKPEFYTWLAERNVGFCNIDQPVIGRSLKATEHATSSVRYARLHGRNYAEWFAESEEDDRSGKRYNYLYGESELDPWVERIQDLAKDASTVFVILNNHPEAKALVNAFQLIHALTGKKLDIPEPLVERYRELEPISSERRGTPRLFPD